MSAASPTLKVLKWSFLGAGIAYGFFHNRTLAQQADVTRFQKEWARKEKLISEAKAEYARLHAPKQTVGGVITDPEDPNFDIVKAIDYAVEQLK